MELRMMTSGGMATLQPKETARKKQRVIDLYHGMAILIFLHSKSL